MIRHEHTFWSVPGAGTIRGRGLGCRRWTCCLGDCVIAEQCADTKH
jgi:hypothetical protein